MWDEPLIMLAEQVHWDQPDDALRACLARTSEFEDVVLDPA